MSYYQPLVLTFLVITAIGLIRLRNRCSVRLPAVGLLCLFLLSWEPCAWLLSRPLEIWYPAQPFPRAPAQAIVVLAEYVDPPTRLRPYSLAGAGTIERCEFAAWLYRQWHPLPILVVAGLGAAHEQPLSVMRRLLQQSGVPDAVIWSEDRSRNTHENAVYGSQILRQHGIRTIALVVEAQSMPRAAACFQKQGIEVVPAPCSFYGLTWTAEQFLPGWKGVNRNEVTLHESAGLVWYWFRGWI